FQDKPKREATKRRRKLQNEEGTTRPSPTASVLEAYHAVPPSALRNLVARMRIFPETLCAIHTANPVDEGTDSCNSAGVGARRPSPARPKRRAWETYGRS